MFETLTIDVTNVKKILKCCPYYDDIINSDIMYNDDLSIDLIEWYKDIIFSCNGDNEEDIKIIRNIDRCMYIYINDNKYKKGLKKRIINNDINLNDNYKEVVNKILNYTEEYEENELLNINPNYPATSTTYEKYVLAAPTDNKQGEEENQQDLNNQENQQNIDNQQDLSN